MICSVPEQCDELNATNNLVEKLSHEKSSGFPRAQPFWILHLVESAGPRWHVRARAWSHAKAPGWGFYKHLAFITWYKLHTHTHRHCITAICKFLLFMHALHKSKRRHLICIHWLWKVWCLRFLFLGVRKQNWSEGVKVDSYTQNNHVGIHWSSRVVKSIPPSLNAIYYLSHRAVCNYSHWSLARWRPTEMNPCCCCFFLGVWTDQTWLKDGELFKTFETNPCEGDIHSREWR